MTNNYLKPMLDPGSPRVFNVNVMTRNILAKDPEAKLFFRCRQLNDLVLIKDTIPENDRRAGMPSVGTKLYFPFNENDIYEGGRTVFLHEAGVEKIILQYFGEDALDKDMLRADVRTMEFLGQLPSLDPFLIKDVFQRQKIEVNPGYFEVSEETMQEIETYMLQRFEPLVRAAFPGEDATDDKARQLIEKIWEARDFDALKPLIDGFRLPPGEALDIFASWRGIVYYSYQYQRERQQMMELMKWLAESDHPYSGVPANENKEVMTRLATIKDRLRTEWKSIETIVQDYEDGYDKMFVQKTSSSGFLTFLRGSNKTYWMLGNALGKTNQATYCWDVITRRYKERKLPWANLQEITKLLAMIFEADKKATTAQAW